MRSGLNAEDAEVYAEAAEQIRSACPQIPRREPLQFYLLTWSRPAKILVGGLAVDTNGSACVVGSTSSTNFPVMNALQPDLVDDVWGNDLSQWFELTNTTAMLPQNLIWVPFGDEPARFFRLRSK